MINYILVYGIINKMHLCLNVRHGVSILLQRLLQLPFGGNTVMHALIRYGRINYEGVINLGILIFSLINVSASSIS